MEQFNRIELKGKIGSVRAEREGNAVFSLWTQCIMHGSDGTWVATDWHRIKAEEEGGITAETLAKIVTGKTARVFGEVRPFNFTDSDGKEREGEEVYAHGIEVLEPEAVARYSVTLSINCAVTVEVEDTDGIMTALDDDDPTKREMLREAAMAAQNREDWEYQDSEVSHWEDITDEEEEE